MIQPSEYGRDDGDIRKAGLAVPFIGVIVIAVVIAIILFVVSVKLMKSYCCFCRKEDEDANEPRLNPFQDYAPSKCEAAAPREFPLQRDRVITLCTSKAVGVREEVKSDPVCCSVVW